ncbi:MAG: hypothetical protein WC564_01135 [Patescibacteria group bacterium]
MKNYCQKHPCLKTESCPDQIFLGQAGTQKLCSKNKKNCPFFHPLAFGRFEPEDRIKLD